MSLETISKFGRTRPVSCPLNSMLANRSRNVGLIPPVYRSNRQGETNPVLPPDARRLVALLFSLS